MGHFLTDMSHRVDHQKQNQPALTSRRFVWFFVVQLGLWQTQAMIKTVLVFFLFFLWSSSLSVCAAGGVEYKNETKPELNSRLLSFLVFNTITHVGKKCSD